MRGTVALLAAFLFLAACGGGGGGRTAGLSPPPSTQPPPPPPPEQPPPPPPVEPPPEQPSPPPQPSSPPPAQPPQPPPVDRTIPSTHTGQKRTILQYAADTLLRASEYIERDLSFTDGMKDKVTERRTFTCTGTSCTRTLPGGGAETTSLSSGFSVLTGFVNVSRSQFRVLKYDSGQINYWEGQTDYLNYENWSYVRKIPFDDGGAKITVDPTTHVYGVWGDHGFAKVQAGEGRYKGVRKSDNVPFEGTSGFIVPYVVGNAADEAPGGTGSASWKGPAEAVAVGTHAHQRGTATLTIADLSDPALSVSIVIQGQEIGSSNWNSIALTGSRFDVGTKEQDRLVGFFSPGHVESYGVFDTQTWLGVFGAKRKWAD